MKFGEALQHLQGGGLLQRSGWNGKGMFIFQRPEDILGIDTVVNNVKSLPQKVKDYFKTQQQATVKFTSYLCMKAADGSIVNGWLASQTDMMADDWQIFSVPE